MPLQEHDKKFFMNSASTGPGAHFSLVQGGPFHALLRRLGLTGTDQLPTQRAGLLLALSAWLLPALFVVIQSLVDDDYRGWGYFSDWTVYARYLIAIWIMIATERYADARLIILTQHFRSARIISNEELPLFKSALDKADRSSSSAVAELCILAAVMVWSGLTAHYTVALSGVGWDGSVRAGDSVLSWAGEAARFISTPIFLFLVLRWVWRFIVWTVLLYRISRFSLQLTPLHPDRSAGLGFLAIFPGIFSGLIFALSCVVAAQMVKDIGLQDHAVQTVWFAIGGWVMISSALVIGPLLVFVKPLYALRERALLEYGRLASHHHLAFHRKWIDEERSGEELMGSGDPSSASDLNATVEAVQQLRYIPVDFPAILQLLVSAGVPLLSVVATQVPIGNLLKWLIGTLF